MIILSGTLFTLVSLVWVGLWIKSLTSQDYKDSCDKEQCKTCPFPCEKRKSE